MSWPLRIATLSKGVGAFTLTLNRAPILLNGQVIRLNGQALTLKKAS